MTEHDDGPSPDEQARVDAEQLALVKAIRAERVKQQSAADNERRERDRKALAEAQAKAIAAENRLKAIEARLDALEARK